MSKYCAHCGYANAENVLRCENCQHFAGVSKEDKGLSVFSPSRLIVVLVVVGLLSMAIYKVFDKPSVAKPVPVSSLSNSAQESLTQQDVEIKKAEADRRREQKAELYRQKKARRKEQMEGPKDLFGNPNGCETAVQANGETVSKGDCHDM